MKNRKLALRYAHALLAALPDAREQEAAATFLDALAEAMQTSRELRDLLLDPAVPRSSRKSALRALAAQRGMPERVGNFLGLVVDHGRVPDLPAIAQVFREARENAAGIVPASITTAAPLSDELKQRARAALENLTGRQVHLSCEVEPALLGGAVTRIGSQVYDGSLRTQLVNLRRRMAAAE